MDRRAQWKGKNPGIFRGVRWNFRVRDFSADEFPAPDFYSANYTKFNKFVSGRGGFDKLVEALAARGDATPVDQQWGAALGYQRRVETAKYKITEISPGIAAEINRALSQSKIVADVGCGDTSMGQAFSKLFPCKISHYDITNSVPADAGEVDFKIMGLDGTFLQEGSEPPAVVLALHMLHHVAVDLDSKPSPEAMLSWLKKLRSQIAENCLVLLREHDCGFDRGSTRGEVAGYGTDPAKVGTVCLTHIKYELNESSTAGISGETEAKKWLAEYRLGLTSAENLMAMCRLAGFFVIETTRPTMTEFSYYALLKAV